MSCSTDDCAIIYDIRYLDTPLITLKHEGKKKKKKYFNKIILKTHIITFIYIRNFLNFFLLIIGYLEPDSCGIVSAKWMNKTDVLITGGTDSTLRFWDIKRGDPEIHNIFLNDSSISSISLTDGNLSQY